MATLHQGEMFPIPFRITYNDNILTPNECEDVRIIINGIPKSLSENTVGYADDTFFYLCNEKDSFNFGDPVRAQVGVKFNAASIFYSDEKYVEVGRTNLVHKGW